MRMLPIDSFGIDRRSVDGHNYRCKECIRTFYSPEYRKINYKQRLIVEARYRENNRETVRASVRAHYRKTIDKQRDRSKINYRNNKAYYNERNATNWKNKRSQYLIAARKWAQSDRGKYSIAMKNARRRAATKNFIDFKILHSLITTFNGLCAWCLLNKSNTFDHIMPIALNGQHVIGNLVPSCRSCNSKKGAQHPVIWSKKMKINLNHILKKVNTTVYTSHFGLQGMPKAGR